MSRPVVSQTNLERIESYQGEHFDDKLGTLLLRVKVAENKLEITEKELLDKVNEWIDCDSKRGIWKGLAVFMAAICIGLIFYIVAS